MTLCVDKIEVEESLLNPYKNETLKKTSSEMLKCDRMYAFPFTVNLIAMTYGMSCGWSSAAFAVLNSTDTPLISGPLNEYQLSWVVSLLCVGGLIGNIFFGCINNRWGRKLPLLAIALPMTVCITNDHRLLNIFLIKKILFFFHR